LPIGSRVVKQNKKELFHLKSVWLATKNKQQKNLIHLEAKQQALMLHDRPVTWLFSLDKLWDSAPQGPQTATSISQA